jgi:predicted transcriptional regulator
MSNELPSFWKPNISKIFTNERIPAKRRAAKKSTPEENAEKARSLREQGASYGEIAQVLGVTRSTVLNYIRSYPYRKT